MKKKGKSKLKILFLSICAMLFFVFGIMLVCNQIVVSNAEGKVFSELDSIAPTEWGLLLGTTPQTRIGNRQNLFFKYRIEAAEQLYMTGKIKRILISGDENSLDGVNEVVSMRDTLIDHGVDGKDIILDGKGFRTLDSVVRVVKVYGIHSFVVISQQFHNERAIYLAEHLNLDVENIQAYNAESPNTGWSFLTYAREYLARIKMFWDILTEKQPKELGEIEPLNRIIMEREDNKDDFWRCINSVLGHNEQDTITGNFTGKGIDTLYVSHDLNKENGDKWQFYAESPNKNIPKINLWGFREAFPKLVNEGDLDGNGTCEVGYLHTWMNSQWRTYRVFTLLNGKWYYLIKPDHDYMETSEHFRYSKKEILEPSEKTGWIKVNYETQGMGAMIKDTIVKPDYSPIDD